MIWAHWGTSAEGMVSPNGRLTMAAWFKLHSVVHLSSLSHLSLRGLFCCCSQLGANSIEAVWDLRFSHNWDGNHHPSSQHHLMLPPGDKNQSVSQISRSNQLLELLSQYQHVFRWEIARVYHPELFFRKTANCIYWCTPLSQCCTQCLIYSHGGVDVISNLQRYQNESGFGWEFATDWWTLPAFQAACIDSDHVNISHHEYNARVIAKSSCILG